MDSLSATCAALADPTRRAILARLAAGVANAGAIAGGFNISAPAISRHLRVLEAARLIDRTKDKQWRRCRLRPEPLQEMSDWLARYRRFWDSQFDALAEFLTLTKEKPTMANPAPQKTAAAAGYTLTLARVFKAPRARVFAAFTDPELLRLWWGPKGFTTPVAEIDLKVGGPYRLEMKSPDGKIHRLSGVYRAIVRPERLAYTFIWAQGEMAGLKTQVVLEFRDHPQGTELILTHSGLPSAAQRDDHKTGWTSSFDCLLEAIAEGKIR